MSEAKILANNGVKEIILLGQNVNAYNNKNYRLSDLIIEIEKIPEILRIRYTTSHPRDMTDDLIETYGKSKKLMPFIHLPVQSGSSKILKGMNRKHTREEYLRTIKNLIKVKPNLKFSSMSSFIRNNELGFNRIIHFYNLWFKQKNEVRDFILIKYEDMKGKN